MKGLCKHQSWPLAQAWGWWLKLCQSTRLTLKGRRQDQSWPFAQAWGCWLKLCRMAQGFFFVHERNRNDAAGGGSAGLAMLAKDTHTHSHTHAETATNSRGSGADEILAGTVHCTEVNCQRHCGRERCGSPRSKLYLEDQKTIGPSGDARSTTDFLSSHSDRNNLHAIQPRRQHFRFFLTSSMHAFLQAASDPSFVTLLR